MYTVIGPVRREISLLIRHCGSHIQIGTVLLTAHHADDLVVLVDALVIYIGLLCILLAAHRQDGLHQNVRLRKILPKTLNDLRIIIVKILTLRPAQLIHAQHHKDPCRRRFNGGKCVQQGHFSCRGLYLFGEDRLHRGAGGIVKSTPAKTAVKAEAIRAGIPQEDSIVKIGVLHPRRFCHRLCGLGRLRWCGRFLHLLDLRLLSRCFHLTQLCRFTCRKKLLIRGRL